MSAYRSVSRTSLKPGAYMQRERPDHTLQPTALVNEADLRLIKAPQVAWDDRAHFFGIAARGMRQILVDHARKRRAHKRGWPARAAQSVATLADPAGGLEMDVLVRTRRSTSWPSSIRGKRRSSSSATSTA